MEKWGIIQLSSSSLKFYTLCLTPIVIMAPEYFQENMSKELPCTQVALLSPV